MYLFVSLFNYSICNFFFFFFCDSKTFFPHRSPQKQIMDVTFMSLVEQFNTYRSSQSSKINRVILPNSGFMKWLTEIKV